MSKHRIPQKGDVYWIDPNPISGREIKDRHRYIVITPKEINALGIIMAVPVTSAEKFSRIRGLTIAITGHDTTGVAVCNQVRSFDIEARIKSKTARYIETLAAEMTEEIINRVISIIDPA
jgi:mRNA interferase ChpB